MRVCLACDHELTGGDWRCRRCGFAPEERGGVPCFAPELAEDNQDYESDCYAEALELGDANYWRATRLKLILWGLERYFPRPRSFLEIGCGLGYVLAAIARRHPGVELSGSDIYLESLEHSRRAVPEAGLFQADASQLPFRSHFAVAGAFDVLEHLDDDVGTLARMLTAVEPGGGIVVTVPQHPSLWSQRDVFLCHKRRYTRRELVGKVVGAGFEVLKVTSFFTFPFPAMAWANWRDRKPREGYHPYTTLRVGKTTNALLTRLLDVERFFIKLGVSYPFGGSLFLAARRPG
jgi:SAM-dependent methyltransferase